MIVYSVLVVDDEIRRRSGYRNVSADCDLLLCIQMRQHISVLETEGKIYYNLIEIYTREVFDEHTRNA